jgi:type IV secretory pathway VirB10-like protein
LGIAAQAVGVVALGAVVYFAFLHTDGSDTPTSIEVDDGVEVSVPPQRSRRPEPKPKANPRPRKAKRAPRPVAVPRPPAPPIAEDDVDTPIGSQYQSVVARILGDVARAGH